MADANVPRGRIWSNDELELLIDIWGSAELLSKMDWTSRNASVFKEMVTTLSNAEYERTAKEVKNKIKNLKRDYKKVVGHNKRSGVEAREIMFQDKLDLILGDRRLAQPVAVAQSGRRSNVRSMTEKDDDRSSLDRRAGQDTNENATMTIEDGDEWSHSEVNSTASSVSTPSCESPPARMETNNGMNENQIKITFLVTI
ncbi:hypothetical protein HOLleu_00781 [Holothuria leucospilota]|uniref:Myb/SANT-like DNA-binding domain-containing protein n=1 Tax=Holothuria leucospilota TaxID=206669 RepID=A0A9Q1CP34_HOLLE|nr:hypothetical protein HOLleu_00781 [Holothuria leucospilota]